ncbi:MAG: ferric reductase [Anaerolineae bacterium]|jgi:sulfoxide reductase heme-binding subunit YedZ
MDKKRQVTRGTWYLILTGGIAVGLVIGLIALQPFGSPLNWFIRGMASLGYLTVFLTIVSSAYMKQIYRILGRPFVKAHHILSVAGLILITLHPIGVTVQSASPAVLLPRFESWGDFLRWGGAPAWYLIGAASLAAVLRNVIGKRWRLIHILNYIAFALATIHATQIGSDFQRLGTKILAIILASIVVVTFIQKRLQRKTP